MEISYSNISSTNQSVNASEVQSQVGTQEKGYVQSADSKLFYAGTQLKGEIIDIKGSQVSISLENGQILNARLEADFNLTIGQQVSFEVVSNTGTKITIKPADLDYKQNLVLQKALQEASLPITEKNLLLVNTMLKEGMSINKQSLTNMLKQLNMNQGANIETIVKMCKLGIEVTKDNIKQFENYKNYEHRIVKDISNVLNDVSKLINEISTEDKTSFNQFQIQLLELLQNTQQENPKSEIKSYINESFHNEALDQKNQVQDDKSLKIISAPGEEFNKASFVTSLKSESIHVQEQVNPLIIKEGVLEEKGIQGQSIDLATQSKPLSFVLSEQERESLTEVLKGLGANEVTLYKVKEGTITNHELMNQIKSLVMELDFTKDVFLFGSKEYEKVLKQALKEQWLVTPQDLKEPDKMTRFYRRLEEQTRQLSMFLEQTGKEASPLMKDITNIRSNLNFMEQINQNVTYLQIPIQFTQKEAHSDLYVYTNKKSLRENDGNLSVLLHLDMEELGMTDIYIDMKKNQVSAKFHLQDTKAMDLVANNLEQLVEKLREKGYYMSASVGKIEKEQKFMEDFLEKDKVTTSLKRYAFDVRT